MIRAGVLGVPDRVRRRSALSLSRSSRELAAFQPPDTAGAILECLGLPARPPPVVPARRVAPALFESAAD